MHMWDGFFWGMPSGLFLTAMGMPVMFLIAVVVLLFLVLRSDRSSAANRPSSTPLPGDSPHQADSATEILRQRFARGEINEEEYWHRRRVLESSDA